MDSTIVWFVLGVMLLILEMFSGTFVLVFISLGCFGAGLISFLPNFATSQTVQIIVCSMITVVGTLGFRKPLQNKMLKSLSLKSDIGKEIVIDHHVEPHSNGRISYQGSSWQVTNLDADVLKRGDRVIIVGVDGNTLLIRKVL